VDDAQQLEETEVAMNNMLPGDMKM
jgi:myosin-5